MHPFSFCKTILTGALLGLTAACAGVGSTAFSGESSTYGGNNVLRNDVFAQIRQVEGLMHQCRDISAVNSRIVSMSKPNGRMAAHEIWTITACGKQRDYPVWLREDERGETDFTVRATP